jgi:hypothetical protein
MNAPIYMYYQLNNFYQNHRRYVKSRSDEQLRASDLSSTTDSCEPLATRSCSGDDADGALVNGSCYVYPCGLIAWSVFNDTFYYDQTNFSTDYLKVTRDTATLSVPWTSENIAWASDKDKKFIQITNSEAATISSTSGTPSSGSNMALPYDAYKYFLCQNTNYNSTAGNLDSCPTGARYADVGNEEFIVWMRTSGLPDFRKLHRIINTDLKAGDTIEITVNNVFPVTPFDGEKRIVFSTTTWIGGKNQFLGWAYIVVAILCIVLAMAFGIKQAVHPRALTTSSQLTESGN